MDISSSTSTSSLWATPQVNGSGAVDSSNSTADTPPAPPPAGHHHHGGAGGGMMKDVVQTLKDLGLDSSSSSSTDTSGTTITGTDATGSTDTSSTGGTDVKAAMSQFMHDLFQAMRGGKDQSSDSGNSSARGNSAAATPAPAYGGIENALQSVISGLNGGSSSGSSTSGDPSSSSGSNSDALSKLQGDFKNLLSALGDKGSSGSDGSDSTTASGGTVDLQKFLTTLEQKMQSHAGSNFSAVGNSISTQA